MECYVTSNENPMLRFVECGVTGNGKLGYVKWKVMLREMEKVHVTGEENGGLENGCRWLVL